MCELLYIPFTYFTSVVAVAPLWPTTVINMQQSLFIVLRKGRGERLRGKDKGEIGKRMWGNGKEGREKRRRKGWDGEGREGKGEEGLGKKSSNQWRNKVAVGPLASIPKRPPLPQKNFLKTASGKFWAPHSAGPACTARLARPIVTPLL